ncbi:MAG: hypothetical protein ACYDH9_26600 [Limisphaerales bacterium]
MLILPVADQPAVVLPRLADDRVGLSPGCSGAVDRVQWKLASTRALQSPTDFVTAALGSGCQRNAGSILPPRPHLGGRQYLPVKNAMRFTFKRVWHFLQAELATGGVKAFLGVVRLSLFLVPVSPPVIVMLLRSKSTSAQRNAMA